MIVLGALIGALVMAFMPWMSGPYWLDVIGTFLCASILLIIASNLERLYSKWKAKRK